MYFNELTGNFFIATACPGLNKRHIDDILVNVSVKTANISGF